MKAFAKSISGMGLGLLLLAACNDPAADQREKATADSLSAAIGEKDSLLMAYLETINEIETNLDQIRDKQGLIVMGPGGNTEPGIGQKEEILRNIAMINTLLAENKEKISRLEAQLSKSKSGSRQLMALAEESKKRVAEAEQEITALKQELAKQQFSNQELHAAMSELEFANAQLKDHVNGMDKKLHTAYYTVGSNRELRDMNVLVKNDGIARLGKARTLNRQISPEAFVEINTTEVYRIGLNSPKARLITAHPENSYRLEPQTDGTLVLDILNPDAFWSISKYLVVETRS